MRLDAFEQVKMPIVRPLLRAAGVHHRVETCVMVGGAKKGLRFAFQLTRPDYGIACWREYLVVKKSRDQTTLI